MREPLRLVFLLPATVMAPVGRHSPCLHGCVLRVGPGGMVTLEGPSREQVFDQARRFLRVHMKKLPPTAIAAFLYTPVPDRFGRTIPRRDAWQIVVNAEVAFVPGALDADVAPLSASG